MRTRLLLAALALAVTAPLATATPAAADSSGCTHHFSGPQVCIRLEGRNGANSATGIWTNPPKRIKARAITLYIDERKYDTAKGTRKGKTISHTWHVRIGTDKKVCAKVKGSQRMACQHTKYIGDRA